MKALDLIKHKKKMEEEIRIENKKQIERNFQELLKSLLEQFEYEFLRDVNCEYISYLDLHRVEFTVVPWIYNLCKENYMRLCGELERLGYDLIIELPIKSKTGYRNDEPKNLFNKLLKKLNMQYEKKRFEYPLTMTFAWPIPRYAKKKKSSKKKKKR